MGLNLQIYVLRLELNSIQLIYHHVEHLVYLLVILLESLQGLLLELGQLPLLTCCLRGAASDTWLFKSFKFDAARGALTLFYHHLRLNISTSTHIVVAQESFLLLAILVLKHFIQDLNIFG